MWGRLVHEICVTGLGAIGSLLGFFASRGLGEPVAVLVRRREQAEEVLKRGVRLEGLISGSYKPVVYFRELGERCKYNVIATKAYDAEEAIRATLEKTEVFVVACNGLGPLETAVRLRGKAIGAVVDYGVTKLSDWEFSVRGLGSIVLGPPRGGWGVEVEPLAEILSRGGARVKVVEDVEPYRWLKLSVNAALNPLTALLRAPNGAILVEPAWSVAKAACEEVAAVARARGIELPEDPVGYLKRVAELTRENKSSTLADIEACRRTEIDFINGAVIRAAEELGLRAPVNEVLYKLVKALEAAACAR